MNKITRLLALVMALLMCMLPALAETAPEDVLATVNGAAVTRAEYEKYLVQLENTYYNYGYDVAVLKQLALEMAVEYKLLDKMIADNGLEMTAEELADAAQLAREDFYLQVDEIVAYYASYGLGDISTEEGYAALLLQVLAELESMGVTEESYIADVQESMAYRKAYDWIVRDVVVAEEDVRARYDELVEADRVAYKNDVEGYEYMQQLNQMYLAYGMADYYVDVYYVPAGYRLVTHILLEADEAALDAYVAAKEAGDAEALASAEQAVLASVQPTVDEINARLAEGESFNDLILEYTTDTGMADAASIASGYEVHPQSTMWVTEFRDASFTVDKVGDVTAPVVTDYGVHIIYYMADIGGAVAYTDDVRLLLEEELLYSLQSTCYSHKLAELKAAAEIVYSEEAQALMSGY
nr:peptidylprolyl isomerase [Clostridia bacterium]